MGEFLRDESLDALVKQLNRESTGHGGGRPEPDEPPAARAALASRAELAPDDPLAALLTQVIRRNATDLLLVPGAAPTMRQGGRLMGLDEPGVGGDAVRPLFLPHAPARVWEQLESVGATDFSLRLQGTTGEAGAWRFRVNLHRQRTGLAAAVRVLPRDVPTLERLGLPAALASLVRPTRGLVLLCGPTGSGKTTTLAALVGEINRSQSRHVVTIEDPIEYEHAPVASLVEQVEIGTDAPSFAVALVAALRQDPDVILVGEMRDLTTIATALTAAETGHLILSTLHTGSVDQSVHRIVDVFPAEQQAQVRHQLALALTAVVCQQLVPRADGRGRVPAVEVLLANPAVRSHIRKNRIESLANELTLGKRAGMLALEESLAQLVRNGTITRDEAAIRAGRPDELESLLHG